MTEKSIEREYFEWLYELVMNGNRAYRQMLTALNEREFVYLLEMDQNRADDGMDLRYRFGYERGYLAERIREELDTRPCSVLEMMAGLAARCEEHIMNDPAMGDRTHQWFWVMVCSLGLSMMTDRRYDGYAVRMTIDKLLRREYEPNGRGGLFTVENSPYDLRNLEIWYQMMGYLNHTL